MLHIIRGIEKYYLRMDGTDVLLLSYAEANLLTALFGEISLSNASGNASQSSSSGPDRAVSNSSYQRVTGHAPSPTGQKEVQDEVCHPGSQPQKLHPLKV